MNEIFLSWTCDYRCLFACFVSRKSFNAIVVADFQDAMLVKRSVKSEVLPAAQIQHKPLSTLQRV